MKVRSSNRKSIKWLAFTAGIIFLWIPASLGAQTLPLTPGEVVRLWLTVYPDNLDRASSMTTLNFRGGIPRQDWIDSQEPILHGLNMKYGQGQIMYEEVRGNEARVILRVQVSSWMISAVKDELYSLVKGEEGLWFIDRVDEYVLDPNRIQ
ncbi:MAG: hypothetical protein VX564_01715 [Nitrospirota bacterium]|nr:hypothetical protein [Nitrospirota bacterium]